MTNRTGDARRHAHELPRVAAAAATPAPEPAITVRGLRKTYGSHVALDGVDLTVRRGEVLALLGPNGAGKTTLVEILEGHRRADAGESRVLGFDPAARDRAFRERIGIVLQEDGPRRRRSPSARRSSSTAPPTRTRGRQTRCSTSSASATARTPAPPTLSGGQRRRLDVALGIFGDPELIFLDEPTTGFDPAARRQSWELIERPARARQDDPAHHPLHGRGAAPRRPRRRPRQRPRDRRGHAGHARPRRQRRGRQLPVPAARRGRPAAAGRRDRASTTHVAAPARRPDARPRARCSRGPRSAASSSRA